MKIVVGLGNPGDKYSGTRHNIGFDVLAELSRRWGGSKPKVRFEAEMSEIVCGDERILLVAPQTYMNLSGRSVQQFVRFFQLPLADLLVVADDLNLKIAQLLSILTTLGTDAVPRLRFGVGRPSGGTDTADYVLSRFRKDELSQLDEGVQRAATAVEVWSKLGLMVAMNQFNADPIENKGSSSPPQ
jgi:peptidyl-tRNA hydrolase, PTH1 family